MPGYLLFLLSAFGGVYLALCRACRISIRSALLCGLLWSAPVFCVGNALHELSHAADFAATGVTIHEIRLVPNIFAGEYNAFVRSDQLSTLTQALAGLPAPFVVDVLLLSLLLYVPRQLARRGDGILTGIVLFALARPVVSLAINGLALRNNAGDFGALAPFTGKAGSVAILLGLALMEVALCCALVLKLRALRAPVADASDARSVR